MDNNYNWHLQFRERRLLKAGLGEKEGPFYPHLWGCGTCLLDSEANYTACKTSDWLKHFLDWRRDKDWIKCTLRKTPYMLKADTHEGFCSRIMLQRHTPGAKLLRVYQRFHGYTSSSRVTCRLPREQNFHPAKCSTILNRLNIWEQAPGANWANLKTLPRVYWHVQNEPGACSGSKTPRVYRP